MAGFGKVLNGIKKVNTKKLRTSLFAFSLIEIMLSLIIVSSILAAFAPIVSRKMNSKVIEVAATASFSKNCADKYTSDCTLCTSKACISCKLDRKAPEGKYLDVDACRYKACTDLFSDCLICAHDRCMLCIATKYIDAQGKCTACGSSTTYVCDGVFRCDVSCKTCSGSGLSCKTCNQGYYLKNVSGTVKCVACSSAVSNCVSCTEAGVCTGCASNYFLSNGTCNAGL